MKFLKIRNVLKNCLFLIFEKKLQSIGPGRGPGRDPSRGHGRVQSRGPSRGPGRGL